MITKPWRSKIIAIGITIGVLFSLATYTVTPVIGQEQELSYDDGSPEFGFVAGPSVAGAVKFTVASSMQVLRLKFHVWGEMKTVRVHVLDANFNSIFSKEVIPSTGWFEVDVSSNNVFVQGDFHVAWQWISESPNGPWLDVDTTPPHHQRSYLGVPGSSPIPAQPNEDYMIRVVVREAGQQEVKFRGMVIGFPDFGGAVGVGGVNIRIDEVLLDPTSNLEIGDVATVTWPMVPPFAYIQVEIGDRVEVYGYYNTQEMPDWWSGVGEHWVSLNTSDHYLEKVEEKPRVKFRGTAACDEDEWYNPFKPYGNYFVDVRVDEILEDPQGKLVVGGLYCVAYQESHGFSEGDCVEVYGTYIEGTVVVGGAYGSAGDYIKRCACEESENGLNTCDLKKGDIIIVNATDLLYIAEKILYNGYWGHTGIYYGGEQNEVVESYPDDYYPVETPGVVKRPITKSGFWQAKDWVILRPKTQYNHTKMEEAANYAATQVGHHYNWSFLDKWRTDKFYCTQLVWRAYNTGNKPIDLDSNIPCWFPCLIYRNPALCSACIAIVGPDEIYHSPYLIKVKSSVKSVKIVPLKVRR